MAVKQKTTYCCSECGYETSNWAGKCPSCGQWNTFREIQLGTAKNGKQAYRSSHEAKKPRQLSELDTSAEIRFSTGISEFDRVLGGGAVVGSLVLVGGAPGIGKSTLLLQMCGSMENDRKVLYVTGEESERQLKLRATRLGVNGGEVYVLAETDLDSIISAADELDPDVIIIDSIQTMSDANVASAPGSITQVRECTMRIMRVTKEKGYTVFVVGHINKEGSIAGPKVLEHMVDCVLYFEGDQHTSYRILRAAKNRFGATNEIGVFEMCQSGLKEVKNPSEYMLSGKPQGASGSIVSCSMEGTRPILVEVQALVCSTNFGMPRRTATGFDYNRLNLLMAVLEKRAGIHMSGSDAYVNVAGGIKVNEPALDLGIVMALVSSFKNRAIDEKTVIFGEVGLAGEVRAVSQAQQRVNEAVKLGFKTCILPGVCMKNIKSSNEIEIIGVNNVNEAIKLI